MKHYSITISISLAIYVIISQCITKADAAGPTSTNYTLEQYTFGAGGIASASSQSYRAFGVLGETDSAKTDANSHLQAGLTYLIQANVPAAPTVTNPGSNYDRLSISLTPGTDPTDTTYALQISTDNFVSDIRYIKADDTVGTSLTPADFQTYTGWGGGSGMVVTGLQQNTTYYVRAKARQGNFTETRYGPAASAATLTPSLTFSLSTPTITFSNLNAGNSYTDSTKTTTLTTSTNAYNGYTVYAKATAPLTYLTSTIPNYTGPNTAPTTWAGTGFGYTTNDGSLGGGTANRFINGGPRYAGFVTSGVGDPVADHTAPLTTPVSNEQFVISYRVTAAPTAIAGTYSNTILYTIVPIY